MICLGIDLFLLLCCGVLLDFLNIWIEVFHHFWRLLSYWHFRYVIAHSLLSVTNACWTSLCLLAHFPVFPVLLSLHASLWLFSSNLHFRPLLVSSSMSCMLLSKLIEFVSLFTAFSVSQFISAPSQSHGVNFRVSRFSPVFCVLSFFSWKVK